MTPGLKERERELAGTCDGSFWLTRTCPRSEAITEDLDGSCFWPLVVIKAGLNTFRKNLGKWRQNRIITRGRIGASSAGIFFF